MLSAVRIAQKAPSCMARFAKTPVQTLVNRKTACSLQGKIESFFRSVFIDTWLFLGPGNSQKAREGKRSPGKPQEGREVPGSPGRPREGSGNPKKVEMSWEAPGSPGKARETPRKLGSPGKARVRQRFKEPDIGFAVFVGRRRVRWRLESIT